jgi:hypothetical protein
VEKAPLMTPSIAAAGVLSIANGGGSSTYL